MKPAGAERRASDDWQEWEMLHEYLPDSSDGSKPDGGAGLRATARKSREELNMIEKQRTRRINQQIQSLRALLETSGLTTKKDKFSILHNTAEYIQQLQQALAASELKNQQLQQRTTTETRPAEMPAAIPKPVIDPLMVQNPEVGATTCYLGSIPAPAAVIPTEIEPSSFDSADYSSNIDYQTLFLNASIAMAVANVDGQFMDCNNAFSQVSGFSRDELRRVSMFNLTPPEEMNSLFTIVGGMLSEGCSSGKHFWKRCRFRRGESHCFVSMWLVRRATGEPGYFQCAIVPLEDINATVVGGVSNPTQVSREADLRLTLPAL